jgi:hypothetical protein
LSRHMRFSRRLCHLICSTANLILPKTDISNNTTCMSTTNGQTAHLSCYLTSLYHQWVTSPGARKVCVRQRCSIPTCRSPSSYSSRRATEALHQACLDSLEIRHHLGADNQAPTLCGRLLTVLSDVASSPILDVRLPTKHRYRLGVGH